MSPAFIFATCNPGSESALKAEMREAHGAALAPAFMRPGLVTWKDARVTRAVGGGPLPVFAHVMGASLGMAGTEADLPAVVAAAGRGPIRLHVFPRVLPENGLTSEEWDALDRRRGGISARLQAAGAQVQESAAPEAGDRVLDVILGDAEEPLFAGIHTHDRWCHPCAGALPRVVLPPDAPSRAWLKMEQALAFAGRAGATALRGSTVVELGSAPGGASLALMQHGARVFGVDTARMDARVLEFAGEHGAGFVHIAASAGEVAKIPLPSRVDMLVSDMNLAPPVALRYIERVQHRVGARVLILTLKMNDRAMQARIPAFLDQIRRFAPGEVRVTQLPANRTEITVFAG